MGVASESDLRQAPNTDTVGLEPVGVNADGFVTVGAQPRTSDA